MDRGHWATLPPRSLPLDVRRRRHRRHGLHRHRRTSTDLRRAALRGMAPGRRFDGRRPPGPPAGGVPERRARADGPDLLGRDRAARILHRRCPGRRRRAGRGVAAVSHAGRPPSLRHEPRRAAPPRCSEAHQARSGSCRRPGSGGLDAGRGQRVGRRRCRSAPGRRRRLRARAHPGRHRDGPHRRRPGRRRRPRLPRGPKRSDGVTRSGHSSDEDSVSVGALDDDRVSPSGRDRRDGRRGRDRDRSERRSQATVAAPAPASAPVPSVAVPVSAGRDAGSRSGRGERERGRRSWRSSQSTASGPAPAAATAPAPAPAATPAPPPQHGRSGAHGDRDRHRGRDGGHHGR